MAKREGISRTRYLLPMELLLYAIVAHLAIVAVLPRGVIRTLLASWGMTAEWVASFGLIGAVGLTLAATEWFMGVGWRDHALEWSCRLRSWCAIAAAAAGVVCARISYKLDLPFLLGLSCFVILFALWSWWGNRRATILLSPEYSTTECEKRMGSERAYF